MATDSSGFEASRTAFYEVAADPELRADVCAPTWKLSARGILLESKDGSSGFGNLRQRLGRSPGKGDAVVMAWSEGNQAAAGRHNAWKWERPRHRWIV